MTGISPDALELGIAGISDAVEIGAGGFGVVYRAMEADLGRTVAVKVLTGNLDESARNRFERERRSMGTLSGHPNIVTVFRGGYTAAGKAYLVMEYLERGSLAARLQREGPLPWSEVLKFAIQLSGALETAHRAGVLHRDIKPGNVLMSSLGNAKLCDFGIARLQGAPETRSSVVTASLAHAPPDIVNGARPSAQSDVYSLASTVYELVTGMPPFVLATDESMLPILARIAGDPVPPLPDTQLPAPVFDVVAQAMEKDAADRPATAADLGQLLAEAEAALGLPATTLPIEGAPPPPGSRQALHGPGTISGEVPEATVVAAAASVSPWPEPTPAPPTEVPPADVSPREGYSPAGLTGAVAPTDTSGDHDPGEWSRPPQAIQRPERPPWLPAAAAAIVAGLILAGAVLWMVMSRGDDTASGSGDPGSSEITTDVGNGDGDGEPTGASETGETTERPPPAEGFDTIMDASGSITIDVPEGWSDIQQGPGRDGNPYLAASPALPGFIGAFASEGVAVTIIPGIQDPDQVLDQQRDSACTAAPERRDLTLPYPGRIEVLTNCGSAGAWLTHTVFVDESQDLTAFMVIQGFNQEDLGTVGGQISNSLELQNNY